VTTLHPDLTELLLRPINQRRVFKKDGQSHLAAWDVRAHLIRCFGFAGWSADTIVAELIHDIETTTKAGKPARKVAYRAQVRLTIHATGATYTEWAVGEATMPDFKHGDAHDFSLKTAESQALKRCATNLGSQFGLSLYDNGRTDDVVRGVFSVKFADDVTVTSEGTEPGVVVDEDTSPPELTRPVERLATTPADDPWASEPAGAVAAEGAAPATRPHPSAESAFRGLQAQLSERAKAEDPPWSRADVIGWVGLQVGRPIGSTKDLTSSEVADVRAILRGARREVTA